MKDLLDLALIVIPAIMLLTTILVMVIGRRRSYRDVDLMRRFMSADVENNKYPDFDSVVAKMRQVESDEKDIDLSGSFLGYIE